MGPQEHAVHGSSNMVHVGAASAHAPVAGSPHAAVAAPQGVGATAAVRMDPWTRELICGVVAGATNVASGFPFDTVKVRLQSAEQGTYRGPVHCLRSILRTEGARGLFRGLTPPLIGGALETGVNYLVYCRVLAALKQQYSSTKSQLGDCGVHTTWELPCRHVPVAGAAAGVALSGILGPTELIKCRMQASGSPYTGPMHCIRTTLATEGARGLTRGLGATMAREVPGNAIFFTVYEALKHNLNVALMSRSGGSSGRQAAAAAGDAGGSGCGTSGGSCGVGGSSCGSSGLMGVMREAGLAIFCGGCAGTVMWAAILPLDVAKTRLQTATPGSPWDMGISQHLALLWRQGGVRALWCGLTPTLLRAFPANAAQWLAWEGAMSAMGGPSGSAGH